jgi:hypothetical protein
MVSQDRATSFTHELIGNYLKSCGFVSVAYDPKMFDDRARKALDASFNIRVFEKTGWGRATVVNNIFDPTFIDAPQHKVVKIIWFSRTQDGAAILYNARSWNGLVHTLEQPL